MYIRYGHPYETEIKASQYPASTRVKADPIPFVPYESSEATLVDTPESLLSMLDELRLAKNVAVDLEHHDEHSYVGLVSLMQISTRKKDWIIDTLKPWREKLQVLNEVFTDPKILKVKLQTYRDSLSIDISRCSMVPRWTRSGCKEILGCTSLACLTLSMHLGHWDTQNMDWHIY